MCQSVTSGKLLPLWELWFVHKWKRNMLSAWGRCTALNASDRVLFPMFPRQKSRLHPTHIRGFKEAISCPRDQQTFSTKEHAADILDSCIFCSGETLALFGRSCYGRRTMPKKLSFTKWSCMFWLLFCYCCTKSSLRWGLISSYTSQFITEGIQRQELEAETMGERCLLACFLACSASFLIQLGPRQPTDGIYCNGLGSPTFIVNQENTCAR